MSKDIELMHKIDKIIATYEENFITMISKMKISKQNYQLLFNTLDQPGLYSPPIPINPLNIDIEFTIDPQLEDEMIGIEYNNYTLLYRFETSSSPPVCECGSDTVGHGDHSTWCPKHAA